jgi:putative Holliday junction resolvase
MCNLNPPTSETDSQWLGLDPGTVRCGLALADTSATLALPFSVVPTEPRQTLADRIRTALGQRRLAGLVVGLPLDQYGGEGIAAVFARELGTALADELDCSLHFVDERFTTAGALARARETGGRGKRPPAVVDAEAAAAILRTFLDSRQQTP